MPGAVDPALGRGVASRQLATFVVGQLLLGVDVDKVQEVLRWQPLTRVPLAPPAVEGLLNLRGQIITAIDLRRQFAMDARDDDDQPMNVVVRTAGGVVSLLVDEIGDVVDLPDTQFAATPSTLALPARELVRGVYTLSDRLLLWLDEERAAVVSKGDAKVGG